MKELKFPLYARVTFIIVGIISALFLLYIGQAVFIPLFYAIFISLLLYPISKELEVRANMNRGIAAFVVLFVFVLILSGFIYFLSHEVVLFFKDIPTLIRSLSEWITHVKKWVAEKYQIDSSQQGVYMDKTINHLLSSATVVIGNIFFKISSYIFWIIIVCIYTYFILCYRKLLLRFLLALVPDKYDLKVLNAIQETRRSTYSYMIGLLMEFVVMSFANCAAFAVLGIKHALLLGLLSALFNFIPYIGFVMACALVWLVTVIHGSVLLAFEAAGLLLILHILDANILFPRLIGHQVKMNALITIIAVLLGGVLWGVSGMFLSIPFSAMLKIIFEHVDELKPWAMLMGTEEDENLVTKKEEP